eukprot:scaffold506375_cov22-Prasinocladus_malaysianus.AAC.2
MNETSHHGCPAVPSPWQLHVAVEGFIASPFMRSCASQSMIHPHHISIMIHPGMLQISTQQRAIDAML